MFVFMKRRKILFASKLLPPNSKCAENMCKYLATHYFVASAAHWKINKESILAQREWRAETKNVFICWQFDRYGIYRLCNAHICQQSHRSEPAVTCKAADFGVRFDVDWIGRTNENNSIANEHLLLKWKLFERAQQKRSHELVFQLFHFID